jgi:hypothetical protein
MRARNSESERTRELCDERALGLFEECFDQSSGVVIRSLDGCSASSALAIEGSTLLQMTIELLEGSGKAEKRR